MEYFDVVDDSDRVIGKGPRPEVHMTGKWHRAIYVFVFNSKGELFLQERSDSKDSEPGLWTCSVSGHLSSGQTYADAAIRETHEEIGVEVKPEPLFYLTYEPYRHHLWIFRAVHDGPFNLDPGEVKSGRFISMGSLRKEVQANPERFSQEFLKILESFTG